MTTLDVKPEAAFDIAPTQNGPERTGRDRPSRAPIAISAAIGLLLVVQLVETAGAWRVLANTRALDLLIRGGVVRLTDMDAGYIDGVPEAELYLRSQTPIDWALLAIALVLSAVAIVARSARFAVIARAHRLPGTWTRTAAVGLRGETRGRFTPFGIADVGTLRDLTRDGASLDQGVRVVNAQRVSSAIEIMVFGAVSVVLVGPTTWIEAMLCGGVILVVATLLARTPGRARRKDRRTAWWRSVGAALAPLVRDPGKITLVAASLLALPVEELVGYLVVQSLSSQFVILGGLTPTVILLALVAGKTATLVQVTPGGFGQFEWAFAAALYAQGQGIAEAVTVTLVFSAVRYLATGMLLLAGEIMVRRGSPAAALSPTTTTNGDHAAAPGGSVKGWEEVSPSGLVSVATPATTLLLRRLFVLATVLCGLYLVGELRELLVDYWLLESLGYESVFWTNLRMQTVLFVVGGAIWAIAVVVPLLRYRPSGSSRGWRVAVAAVVGVAAGTVWADAYEKFLLLRHGKAFGENDPVFRNDIGFYLFDLPAIRSLVWGTALVLLVALALSAVLLIHRQRLTLPLGQRVRAYAGRLARPGVIVLLLGTGLFTAVGVWLTRYDVLTKDNYSSSITNGAEALDVTGLFSTVNLRTIQAIAVMLLAAAIVVAILRCRPEPPRWIERGPRTALLLATPPVLAALAVVGVAARDLTMVTPNEPVIQLDYIQRHIDATNRAWGMDDVEVIDVAFNTASDPLPDVDSVIAHPSIANAQLWPGAVTWLERLLDPQHVERVFLEADAPNPDLVFGVTLDTFRQHQKLRPYYDFLDVDVVNYANDDGMPRLMTSAVRELPLLEPQPWLAFWGQRFVLFTHGYGIVAAPLGEIGQVHGPAYVSSDVPPIATVRALDVDRHAIYYGEGSGTIGFSNVRDLPEFDYPTAQDRVDIFLPDDVDAGVRIDSPLKRLAFAWGAQEFFDPRDVMDLLFSNLITSETRIHYQRQPLDRVAQIAPFLYLDSDPYAVASEGGITWMVNGMTVSDQYPYSAMGELGDKSARRGPFPTDVIWVNYVADSVKATVDAYTGKVTLYQISDEPVVSTWAAVYPGLFTPGSEMPTGIRVQQQYPPQLFHTQFDDHWIYYHATDPVAFFNQEDVFDDADEVLGPMLAAGKGITFSIEPYPTVIETSAFSGVASDEYQFALSQVFTPEGARNLRSIVTVMQSGDDYGHISMLQLAKGSFAIGPEQAESIIDQTADIAQQFGFWNATGVEVIRGYITPIVVDNELIYIEPVFIRSEQNPLPQLARVVAVVRGEAAMAPTLEQAIREAYAHFS